MKTIKNYSKLAILGFISGIVIVLLLIGILISVILINMYTILIYPFKFRGEGLLNKLDKVTITYLRTIQVRFHRFARNLD